MEGDSPGSDRSIPIRLTDLNKDLESLRGPLLQNDRRISSIQASAAARATNHISSLALRSSIAQVPKSHDNMDETRKRLSALLSKERLIRQQSTGHSGTICRDADFKSEKKAEGSTTFQRMNSPQRASPTKYQRARSASPTLRGGGRGRISAGGGEGSRGAHLPPPGGLKGPVTANINTSRDLAREDNIFGMDLRTYKEAYSDEEALMQGLDAEKLEVMSDKVQTCLGEIDAAEDEIGIIGVLDDVQQALSAVLVGVVQMWLLDSSGSLVAARVDGVRNSMSPAKSAELLAEITGASEIEYMNNAGGGSGMKASTTITAGHYLWDEMFSSLKSNLGDRFGEFSSSAAPNTQRGWKSITAHAISPSPTHSPVGLLFAVELYPQTVPLALTKRTSYMNAARIRSLFAKQCLRQCAVSIACRINALGHGGEISTLTKRLNESESRAHAAEGLLAAYEDIAAADGSAAIAESVSRAGVNCMDAPMAWCLLQASGLDDQSAENNNSPFVSGMDQTARRWVSVYSGHRDDAAPMTLQAHSRSLITSLLSIGSSSSQPSILEVSGAELARAGLPVSIYGDFSSTLGSQPVGDTSYTLIAVPIATSQHISDGDVLDPASSDSPCCALVLAFPTQSFGEHLTDMRATKASDVFAESMTSVQFRESSRRGAGTSSFFGTRRRGHQGYWKDRAISQSVMLATMASRAFVRLEVDREKAATQLLKSIPGQLFDIVGKDEWLGDSEKPIVGKVPFKAEVDEFEEERNQFNESYVGGRDAEGEGLAEKFRRCAVEGGYVKGCFLNIAGAMQSEAFARCFGARRGVLLLSTSFASSVGLVKGFSTADTAATEKLDPRSTFFLQVMPSGLQRVTDSPITISCDWMKDLLAGRGVGVSSLSPNTTRNTRSAFSSSFRSRNRRHASAAAPSVRGRVAFEEDNESYVSSSVEVLNELVVNVDARAKSALLLPIRTDGGLCILLLLDKVVDTGYAPGGIQAFHGYEDEEMAFSKLSSFTVPDAEMIISTGICSDMAAALDAARKVHTAQKANSERERLRRQLTQIVEVLKAQREKNVAAKCLSLWRRSAARKGNKLLNTTAGRILHATLEMLKFGVPEDKYKGQRGKAIVSNGFLAFLQCVERQVARAFPGDIVTMVPGDGLSGDSAKGGRRGFTPAAAGGSDDHITVVNSYAQGNAVPFVATSTFTSLEGRAFDEPKEKLVLVGIIRQSTSTSGPFRSSQKSPSEQLDDSIKARILGSIRVCRTKGSTNPFTQEDMQLLGHICDVATVVITALQRGINPSVAVDGDVRSLLLPLLNRAVPCMLETISKSNTDIRSTLSQLAYIIKRISGGDVALLRVTAPGDSGEVYAGGVLTDISRGLGLGGANSPPSGSRGSEIVVSSEDAQAGRASSPFLSSLVVDDEDGINERRAASLREMLVQDRSVTMRVSDPAGEGDATFVADQIVLKLLRDTGMVSHSGSEEVLGEVKVVGAQAQTFDADQCAAVQLLGYILAHSISAAQRMRDLEQELETTTVINRQLEAAIKDSARGIASQKGSGDTLKLRFNCALSLASFAATVPEISSIQSLANYIGESLPSILRVDAAVFLALEEDHERESDVADIRATSEPFFKPKLPRHETAAARATHMDSSSLSLTQLSRIPSYTDDPRAMQSKILLLRKDTGLAFGAILLYRRKRDAHTDAELTTWSADGAADTLINNISSAIASCLSKIEVTETMSTVQKALDSTETLQRERDALRKELMTVTELKAQVDIRCNNAVQDAHALEEKLKEATAMLLDAEKRAQEAVDEIASRNDNQFDRMKSRISDLEALFNKAQDEIVAARAAKEGLEALIAGFSIDPRCNKDAVMQWLADFVHSKQIQQITVSQEETGTLVGGNGLRGLIPAVGEALRTTQPVEIMSSYSNGSIPNSVLEIGRQSLSLSATSAMEFMHAGSALSSDSVAVLCVPNVALPLGSPTKYEHACFVFIKPAKSKAEGFTEAEKAILCGAAKLSSSTLSRTSIRYSQEDYYKFEQVLQRERQLMAMVKQAMISSEATFMRTGVAQGRGELCSSVEGTVISLLSRGERDPCKIIATMWFLPASWSSEVSQGYTNALAELATGSSKKDPVLHLSPGDISQVYPVLASMGMPADAEILHRVLQTGASQRKGSVMWTPLKSPKGDILAVIRVERKLSNNAEERLYDGFSSSSDFGNRSMGFGGGSFSQAGINAGGGGFISSLTAVQEKRTATAPALSDLFITTDEEELISIFARLSYPLFDRIRILAESYASVQQAGEAIAAIQSVKSKLEEKLTLEVAYRLELEEALKSGADMLGSTTSQRVATGQLLDSARRAVTSVTSSDDCCIIFPKISDQFRGKGDILDPRNQDVEGVGREEIDFSSFNDGALFTLDMDKVNPSHVRLEESDLEAMAMRGQRAIAVPSIPDSLDIGATSRPTASAAAQLGRQVWQSWSVRRAQSRGLLDAEAPLYALSVPYVLRRGSKGVVTVFRRGAPYTATDRDCIAWVARVLGYCMEMMGDDEMIFEIRQRAASLEREVVQLREAEARLRQLERHGEELERNMCGAPSLLTDTTPSASDLHHLLQNNASGHIILPARTPASPSLPRTAPQTTSRVRWSSPEGGSSAPSTNVNPNGSLDTESGYSDAEVQQFQSQAIAKVQKEWEVEAVQVILVSSQTALGIANVELSDAEEAAELVGELMNAAESANASSEGGNHPALSSRYRSTSSTTKKTTASAKKDEKGSVQSAAGQIHFWMTHCEVDNVSAEGVPGTGNVLFGSVASFGIERTPQSTKEQVLLVVAAVQHEGYPPVWAKATFNTKEAPDVSQMRLRFSVLLKLLDCQSIWRNRLLASMKELVHAEAKQKGMRGILQMEQQRFSEELTQVMAVHKSTLEFNKSKYKIAVQLRAKQCKQAEELFCASLAACAALRRELTIFGGRHSNIGHSRSSSNTSKAATQQLVTGGSDIDARCPSTLLWLRSTLTKLCKNIATATGCEVAVGAAKAASSHAGIGGNITASYEVKWFTNAPLVIGAAGGENSRMSRSSDGGVSNSADSFDPLHVAITQSRIVVIGSAEDEKNLHSAIDFISQVVGGQGPLATVLSPNASYAAGTVIVPVPLIYLSDSRSVDVEGSLLDADTRPDAVVIVARIYAHTHSAESDEKAAAGGKEASAESIAASASRASSSFSALICSAIASWHSFASCIQDTVHTRECFLNMQLRGKRVAVVSAVRSAQSVWGAEANKALLFERMRVGLLQRRIGHSEQEISRLLLFKKRVSILEQSMADWTEIVRGVNSAANGLAGGVPGLWMQACRILMTLISSHMTLTSCGLCLTNDTGDVFDLSVRELSTPMPFRNRTKPSSNTAGKDGTPFAELPDYARGVLELTPATELGDKIHSLLYELLNQPAGTHTIQRLYKLAGQSEEDELHTDPAKNPGLFTPGTVKGAATPGRSGRSSGRAGSEQVWLVPVRSATSVLAVLRVTVEIPRMDFAGTGMTSLMGSIRTTATRRRPVSTPASGVFASGGGRLGVSFVDEIADEEEDGNDFVSSRPEARTPAEDSKQQRISSAQSNLINFAEVFSPLVAAAQQIEVMRGTSSEKDDVIRKYVQQQKVTIPELNRSLKKNALISGALSAVNEVADVMASGLTDFKVDPKSSETQVMVVMGMLADLISSRLTTALSLPVNVHIKDESRKGRKSLHASYNLSGAGNEVEEAVREAFHGDANMTAELSDAMGLSATVGKRSISHHLIDHTGYEYGTISVSLNPSFLGDDGQDGIVGGTDSGPEKASKQLFPHIAEMELHTSCVADILPSVAGVVSSVLLCCTREFEAKERFAEAMENISVMEADLQVHQFRSEELDRAQTESLKSRDYFRGLADIVNDCLNFSAAQLTWPKDDLNSSVNDWQPSGGSYPAAIASMPHLLRSLASRIPSLIGRISTVRFATISSTSSSSTGAFDEMGEAVDESKGGEGRRRNRPRAGFDDRHKLRWFVADHEPFGSTRIHLDAEAMGVAENLARACIFKLSRSSVDISGVGDGVRVFTYPLLRTSGPTADVGAEALGVMQVFLSLTEEDFRGVSAGTITCTQVDNLCEDLARSVSCAVSVDQCKFQLKHACLERAELWRSVASGAAAIAKNCLSEDKFPEVLASREVITALRNAGIRITLRWQGSQKGQQQHHGQALGFIDDNAKVSTEGDHNSLIVRLDENGETVAEISCDADHSSSSSEEAKNSHMMASKDGGGISSQVAAEAVEIIGMILRSTSALHRMKSFEASDMMQRHWATVQQLEKLKVELAAANANANIAHVSGSAAALSNAPSAVRRLSIPDDVIGASRSSVFDSDHHQERVSKVDATPQRSNAASMRSQAASLPLPSHPPSNAPVALIAPQAASASAVDVRREAERFERLRRHRMSAVLGIIAPAVSELITVLREFELLDESATESLRGSSSGRSLKVKYEYAWESFARVSGRAIGRLTAASGRKPHVSLIVWDRNEPLAPASESHARRGSKAKKENEQDQNNVMRIRVYDTTGDASDQDRIAFTLPTSLQAGASTGYGLPAGIIANATSFGGSAASAQFVGAAAVAQSVPILERALRLGGTHEIVGTTSPSDLVGIDQRTLADLVTISDTTISNTASGSSSLMGSQSLAVRLSVLCAALHDVPTGISAVLRVVHPVMPDESEEDVLESVAGNSNNDASSVAFCRSLLRPAVELLTSIGGALIASSIQQREQRLLTVQMSQEELPLGVRGPLRRYLSAKEAELVVAKFVEMHNSLCLESIAMLEPPRSDIIQNSSGPRQQLSSRMTHPASLSPLAASQDTCLKILLMVRNVLKADGAALLLTDPSTVPVSYQVIHSGGVLSWSGVEHEAFGVISARSVYGNSLVEHCIKTKSIVATGDVSTDERFGAALDGNCPPGTSLVVVPLKGRGHSIVGTLMAARKPFSAIFSQEDSVAAELVASYGSIGLYWCQGLGAMHRQLNKYATKVVQMEKDLSELAPLKSVKKT